MALSIEIIKPVNTLDRNGRLDALLSKGYFPKELPPPFRTISFARAVPDIAPIWSSHERSLSGQDRRNYPPISNYVRFDMARKGHLRRTLGIPNPISQYYLTACLCDHYDSVLALTRKSDLSLTPADIDPFGKRAIPIPKLSILGEKRLQAYATSSTILQTDVLSFYHSVYTHSIPWAIHGKKVAKRNRNPADLAMFGNKIDQLVRSCQDGQTIGIPVGPDTSRLISEVILSAVEAGIKKSTLSSIKGGFRYIDDYFLCFDSSLEAEAFLAGLRESILSFDLQLNASKTHVMGALDFNEVSWPGDLASLRIGSDRDDQKRDLLRFFTETIRLSKALNDESIASYAVRKSSRFLIEESNWDVYEPLLLRTARENTNCLDAVVKILCTYAAAGYPISSKVTQFAESIIAEHAPYNHHYEVAWTLWLCRSLGILLSPKSTSLVASVENSICACLFMLLRSRSLLSGRGAVADWIGPVTSDDLFTENWLIVYEAGIRKSWRLSGAEAAVNDEPHFRSLRDRKVTFFETTATNVALELPRINYLLEKRLGTRRSAVLDGTILFESRTPRSKRQFEKLGEDYGNDEPDWHSGRWMDVNPFDDD